jgi:hypothetical protein
MNSIIRRNIRRDTRHELDNVILKTSLWEGLHRLFPSAAQNASVFDSLSADEINDYFVSISTPQNASPYLPLILKTDELNRFAHLTFNFREITEQDLLLAWKRTKNKQSTSSDVNQISPIMLHYSMKSSPARRALLSVVNSSIREEIFPSALKTARVVPVPKVSQPKSPSEFRPIAIQPHLAKLFEKCLFDQLYYYLEKYGMLTEHQFGFRRGHSTTHACISIADYVYES